MHRLIAKRQAQAGDFVAARKALEPNDVQGVLEVAELQTRLGRDKPGASDGIDAWVAAEQDPKIQPAILLGAAGGLLPPEEETDRH